MPKNVTLPHVATNAYSATKYSTPEIASLILSLKESYKKFGSIVI